jgi:ankyrin repeat protein
MAHQEGWIELYTDLENGRTPNPKLVKKCLGSRTGIGETMLHWYAIEGESSVLEKLIKLGFDVNVQNDFGDTPVMEASLIGKWDNVKVLLDHGANLFIQNQNGEDYFSYLRSYDKEVPNWVRETVQR